MACDMRATVMIVPRLLSMMGPCWLPRKGRSRLACGPSLDFGPFCMAFQLSMAYCV